MSVIRELLNHLRQKMTEMTSAQRASMLTMVITVAALLMLVIWLGTLGEKQKYVPLNVPVPLAQADTTKELLTKAGITDVEYDYENGLVRVLERDRYKALSVFAKEQLLPTNGGGGFEKALKETKFTDTQAITGHRFMEALQNEVVAMIQSIDGIDSAKVIFADAEKKSLFRVPMRQRATVTVKTAYNKPLTQDMADTIIAMVAYAKSGLQAEDVSVTDQSGRNFRRDSDEQLTRVATKQMAMNRAASDKVKKDVEELVRRAVPNCEAYAWVDTTWDLSRRKEVQHRLDAAMPKQVNKLKITERHTDEPGAIVGTQPNIRRNTNMQPEGNGRKIERFAERTESKVLNEFSYTDTETVPDPKITKQTISVIVHLPYEYRYLDNDPAKGWIMEDANSPQANDPTREGDLRQRFPVAAVKDDQLLALENSIRKAAGMLEGEDRREVIIQQIPWRPQLEVDRQREVVNRWEEFLHSNAVSLVLMGILFIAIVFLYLQAKRVLPTEEIKVPSLAELAGGITPKVVSEQDKSQADFENLRSRVGDFINEDPMKATSIVRRWITARSGND
ncbi:MAG: hypothetical protein LBP75_09845 [Planctomycetota bacterium]|jgi:flagellar biosynthesis/type III secretory pathway M-ring protein FliF/YscJ|nr:hypothetical protein [Planctomycetota bacterium]